MYARKQVKIQMHKLAGKLADEFKQKLESRGAIFGQFISYNNIFFGICQGECVTIEEFVPGDFQMHVNNDGTICGNRKDTLCLKAVCFCHFSYVKSGGQLTVLDIQGSGYTFLIQKLLLLLSLMVMICFFVLVIFQMLP